MLNFCCSTCELMRWLRLWLHFAMPFFGGLTKGMPDHAPGARLCRRPTAARWESSAAIKSGCGPGFSRCCDWLAAQSRSGAGGNSRGSASGCALTKVLQDIRLFGFSSCFKRFPKPASPAFCVSSSAGQESSGLCRRRSRRCSASKRNDETPPGWKSERR